MTFDFRGKSWGPTEWCVVMGYDAMRIALGQKPKTFTFDEVIAWLNSMRDATK